VRVNAAMLAQYGATETDFLGLTPNDFFAHDLPTGRQLWQEMFDKGSCHTETQEQKFDGTPIWIDGDYICLYTATGEIMGHFGIQRDITDRKRTEAELERFNQALSYAMEGISLIDLQGRYVQVNQAYADAVGYSPKAMIGMEWQPTVHPNDLATVQMAYQQMLDQGKVEVEAQGVRRDGSIFYKQLVMVTAYDMQQQMTGHYCFMKDISDRKASELALQASEQRYVTLAQTVPVGIFRTDTAGHCLYVNDRWCQITGLTAVEARVDGWTQSLHPDDHDRVFAEWHECTQRNLPFQSEYRFQPPHGDITWVVGQATAEYNNTGELIGYVGSITDISAAKRAEMIRQQVEAELQKSEQKFRAVFDHMFQLIGILTPDGALVEANRTALDAIGINLSDVVGQPFWDTPWWTHSPQLQRQLKDATVRAAAGELVRFEAEHILVDGSSIFVDFSMKPVLDETGKVVALIPEGRDISDRKRQEEDLARSNAELQQFAYVASHDLQEPLRMVTSYLELLERRYKGQLDPKADQFINYAVDGAVRMQTLINALLTYSRVGSTTQSYEAVDLAGVLQDVLTNLQVTIAQNSAVITHDPLPQVQGDRIQLIQLLQNLISNGIKFRREDTPHIHIGAKRLSDKWLFSIHDNGIGIEAQYTDRIFIIFQRLHSRAEHPGTGIGLSICKKIVERHGGNLWVESQLDQGSTFYFTLPLIPQITAEIGNL
jgi:PAS domain S-box-containing protein